MPDILRATRWFNVPIIILLTVQGLSYLLSDEDKRFSSTSFTAAKHIAPMTTWGIMFLIGAITITIATLKDDQRLLAAALFIGGAVYTWWALLFAVSIFLEPETASLVGPANSLFIAFTLFMGCWRIRVRLAAAEARRANQTG